MKAPRSLPLLAGLLAVCTAVASAGNHFVAAEEPSRPAAGAGSAGKGIAQLNALVSRFDADHDQSLSPQEQAELLKYVDQTYGQQWTEQAKQWLKAADSNGDGTLSQAEWRQFSSGFAQRTAAPPANPKRKSPPPGSAVPANVNRQTFTVPMSDGANLATDVYLPPGSGPFPVVLTRTPYSKTKDVLMAPAGKLTEHGYAYVVQDERGRYASEGENLPNIGCGWGEHKDGAETVAWILKQPWCNGKIGTQGGSAMGTTQNFLAGAAPVGLAAQYITFAPASMYHHAAYVGGALRQCQAIGWTKGTKFDPKAIELILTHPSYDAFWQANDTTLRFAVMDVPAVHHGGWFDTFQQGVIDSFIGRQHHSAAGAQGRQKLVIGPWHHGGSDHGLVGELRFPNGTRPEAYDSQRWFDYHLKGIQNGIMDEPAVAYYVMGDTSDPHAPGNQWRSAPDWPIPAADTPYYFQPSGALTARKPAGSSSEAAAPCVSFTFDPADPCPTIGGRNLTISRGVMNQNPIESRPDVVMFTTEPLAAPVEVTGRVLAKLFVASSAADTDLSVRLCDVYPDGKSYLFTDGMLRLRYRNSFEKPEPLTPGQVVPVTVDCWSTSIIFNKGHRIRVTVTSSNFPRFDVNSGTGKPGPDGGEPIKQTNRLYCDAAHPSCIVLPVVSEKKAVAQSP